MVHQVRTSLNLISAQSTPKAAESCSNSVQGEALSFVIQVVRNHVHFLGGTFSPVFSLHPRALG